MVDELAHQYERRCPKCGAPMVIRTNRSNQQPFFACTSWPECEFTAKVPEYVRLRQAGATPLPGME